MKKIIKMIFIFCFLCANFTVGSMFANYTRTGKFAVPKYDIRIFVTPGGMSLDNELEGKIEYYHGLAAQAAKEKIYLAADAARVKFKRKYDTTATWQLDMEADANPKLSQKHYDIIDGAIDRVRRTIKKIPPHEISDEKELAHVVFLIVYDELKKYNDNGGEGGEFLLSRGLSERTLDCDLNSVIYLAVGEVLNYPIVTVLIPSITKDTAHKFPRWELKNGEHLNWEATAGVIVNDEMSYDWEGKKKIKFIRQDSVDYRENWKGQLKLAYRSKMFESNASLVKSSAEL